MRSISVQMHLFDKQNVFMFSFLHNFTSSPILLERLNLFTEIIHTAGETN